MGTKHTPEPWIGDDSRIISQDKNLICQFWGRDEENFDNARENEARIVACVNSCAGFSNEELETLGHFKAMHETIVAENKQLRKERIKMHSLLLQFISAFEGENEGREMTKQARLPEPKWVKEAKQITK